MINTFKKTLAGLALAWMAGSAAATPVTDFHNPADIVLTFGGTVSEYTYTHNILDDLPFYVPGTDTITGAKLTISLTDPDDSKETFQFLINTDGTIQLVSGPGPSQNIPNGASATAYNVILSTDSLDDLSFDGLLTVTVQASFGSFAFADSTLVAEVSKGGDSGSNETNLPEPVSLGLFGIGLAGFAASRRRRQK